VGPSTCVWFEMDLPLSPDLDGGPDGGSHP
jgi:hypothetical protein